MMEVETANLRLWNGCEEGWLVNMWERGRVMVLGVDDEVKMKTERKQSIEKTREGGGGILKCEV